ncbi:MAG TPA: aldo/keto reductase [Mycobacteriales bacterium]|nr:aldo/keto reductase [Mycobacteriales bacterium]
MSIDSAGTISLGDLTVPRFGYGTMRLTGPHIFGPPADRDEAVRVLRRAVDAGVRVIDTAWYYGPDVANEILAEALAPYPDDLVIVTKLGGARTSDGGWHSFIAPEQLREGVEHDLRQLGLDSVPVTHLRWMENRDVGFIEALDGILALVAEGKIQRIGLSNIDESQLDLALAKTPVASVSNEYSVISRDVDSLVERCAREGIAFLPFFPLGASPRTSGAGVSDSAAVTAVADRLGASAAQVALSWLLHRSPALLPIPGTSSVAHLEDNLAAVDLKLSTEDMAELDTA